MKIKKRGLSHTLAYWYVPNKKALPTQESLCLFFWMMVAGVTVFPILFVFLASLVAIIWLGTAIVAPLFFGYRVTMLDDPEGLVVPIKRWPKNKHGKNIKPWPIILALVSFGAIWKAYSFFAEVEIASRSVAVFLATLFILFGLRWMYRQTEIRQVIRARFKAVKQGVCPTVFFVEPDDKSGSSN